MWKPEDIRIDSYQAAVPGAKHSIRLTHTPTGTYTEYHSDRSYFRAKKKAEEELADLLKEINNG
jgi:protein subunit release factor A